MILTWTICSNHLALKYENMIVHPNAEEIFELIDCDEPKCIEGMTIPPIKSELDSIKFSQIGVHINCKLMNSDSNGIRLYLYCIKSGKEIPVDFVDGQVIDHCIYDRCWYYINGNVEGINRALDELNILDVENISIRQFIGLMQRIEEIGKSTIENCVEWNKLNKTFPIDSAMPVGLNARLYDYQKTGYLWMRYMVKQNQGCILGDEMGLGKTLQIITLLKEMKNQGERCSLVVAPVSLLQNWKNECNKFAPDLKVRIHHGGKRTGLYKILEEYDVVVIAYSTVVSDLSLLAMIKWKIVILDEAQNIKNPESKRAGFIKKIPREAGIAVTGTPFENHISDIWSILDFVVPGVLGNLSEFRHKYSDDVFGAEQLEPIVTPLLLRRTVSEAANDLPEKVIVPQPISMSESEAIQYEDIRQEIAAHSPNGKIGIELIQALRMFCTHPIVKGFSLENDPARASVKYQRLCEIVENIVSKEEKAIIFTSFNKMFELIAGDMLQRFGIKSLCINGKTPVENRQAIVDQFNNTKGSCLLILNPRAAGTGLNITSANHVIHYNLEWNPALEDQASARAYRRGQKKTVFIYRLFYIDTVEQVINERIEKKRDMSESAVVGTDGRTENKEDIIKALLISPIEKEG